MLEYSAAALAVRPQFFAPYNDITIVVEDTAGENLYTQIIKRLIGDKLAIYSVLGVGGKTQVLQRFESNGTTSSQMEFYIVDGDFDELIGRTCPSSRYFYRLSRYDIESFLIEEIAICIVAEEERPRKNLEQHRDALQIYNWESETVLLWSRLVSCMLLLQRIGDGELKMDLGVETYRSGDDVVPDKSKIESAIARVFQSQSMLDRETFERDLETMASSLGETHSERLRWVSGKDVLIPLATRLLRRHTGRNFRTESLCFRLAKHCEFLELQELRQRILSVIDVEVAKVDENSPDSS